MSNVNLPLDSKDRVTRRVRRGERVLDAILGEQKKIHATDAGTLPAVSFLIYIAIQRYRDGGDDALADVVQASRLLLCGHNDAGARRGGNVVDLTAARTRLRPCRR